MMCKMPTLACIYNLFFFLFFPMVEITYLAFNCLSILYLLGDENSVKLKKIQLKLQNLCTSYFPKPSSGPDCQIGVFAGLILALDFV